MIQVLWTVPGKGRGGMALRVGETVRLEADGTLAHYGFAWGIRQARANAGVFTGQDITVVFG